MKSLKIELIGNKSISYFPSIRFYEIEIENLDDTENEKIKELVIAEKDFCLDIEILNSLKISIEKRIDSLLKDSNFDPFKKDLINENREEYGYHSFEWKGIQYFLYPRMGFEIDREIDRRLLFLKLLSEQIEMKTSMIFKFNEQST